MHDQDQDGPVPSGDVRRGYGHARDHQATWERGLPKAGRDEGQLGHGQSPGSHARGEGLGQASAESKESPKRFVGHFSLLVLGAIEQLREKAYGAEITRYLSNVLGRDVTVAQVYLTLARLEKGQLVKSEFTKPTRERGGRAKRLFTLEAHGVRVLRETAATLRAVTASSTEEPEDAPWQAPAPA